MLLYKTVEKIHFLIFWEIQNCGKVRPRYVQDTSKVHQSNIQGTSKVYPRKVMINLKIEKIALRTFKICFNY